MNDSQLCLTPIPTGVTNPNPVMTTFDIVFVFKLGYHRQRLLSSPLGRGAEGVLRQTYTPLYPLFLEGNHKRLKFLNIQLRQKTRAGKMKFKNPFPDCWL